MPAPGDGERVTLPGLALAATALAHPAMNGPRGAAEPGNRTPGQRLEVTLSPGHVVVDYYVEIAAIRLYAEAKADGAGTDYADRRAEELRTGLRARWDGLDLPLSPEPVNKTARTAEADFVEFHIRGIAPLPAETGTLRVEMGNFPDEPSYMAASVDVSGELVVTESDLARASDGHLRENKHGAWRREEAARVATVSIRPARLWERGPDGSLTERIEGMIPVPWGWVVGGVGVLVALGSAAIKLRRR